MPSSPQRRLLSWRRKEQRKNVENDETPLIVNQESTSGLESKFAEFDRILRFHQWSATDGTSRDHDERSVVDSDVDDRDESHLSDLQRELEAAELGTAAVSSSLNNQVEGERDSSLLGYPEKILDYQSLASASTADSFDVEVAIERIKLQKKAMEQATQDGSAEADEETLRFAQFVAQMEHDFDGAILAMMEAHADTSVEDNNSQEFREERQPEPKSDQNYELVELLPLCTMETVEETGEEAEKSRLEIYGDGNSDEDTDFTPFSAPDCPSDESGKEYNSSQSENDQESGLLYYISSEPEDIVSPQAEYGFRPRLSPISDIVYHPYQEREEPCSELGIDSNQLTSEYVQYEELETIMEEEHTNCHEETIFEPGYDSDQCTPEYDQVEKHEELEPIMEEGHSICYLSLSPISDCDYNPYQAEEEASFEPYTALEQFSAAPAQAEENEELEPALEEEHSSSRPVLSPIPDFGYNPYQETEEGSFEPCIDLNQFTAASAHAEGNHDLESISEEHRLAKVSHHGAQHHVAPAQVVDDEYSCDSDCYKDDAEQQYWGYFRNSKYPVAGASFICLLLALIQVFTFWGLLGLLMNYHRSTINLLDPTGASLPLCKADSGCQRAISVTLNEMGEHQVFGTTAFESVNKTNDDECEGSWFQSPAHWYSVVGDGSKHTAIAFPMSADFEISIMVLEGKCNGPDFHYGPSRCCGEAGESTLSWDTVAGKEYFVAVFGAKPSSTGSFRMTLWNTHHTKEALMDHMEQRNVQSFQDLAIWGSIGISMTFLAAVALT